MSTVAFIDPTGLYDPAPHGYSHLARVPAGSELLLVSGQGGFGVDLSMPPDIRAQFRQALANVETALAAAGATLAHVARTTLLVVGHDAETLTVVAEELARAWPDAKPASTLIPVPCLALPGMLVEIEATAALPASRAG